MAQERADKPKNPRSLRRQAREVADSLAIAFILAMIIRHYVLEVFKIPTKSMEPTLLGDPWSGDKILVNKFAYDFRDPDRWEIAVFKYPKDTSKNYIKRIVALPGESVRVRYGDLYINGAIARKPWGVQEALWRLTPHSDNPQAWGLIRPDGTETDLAGREAALDCTREGGEMALRYRPRILAYEAPPGHPPARRVRDILISDVMADFQLVPHERAGALTIEIAVTFPDSSPANAANVLDRWEVKLPLDREEAAAEVWRSGAPFAVAAPCRVPIGRRTRLQVCTVDQAVIVRIGGREVLNQPYPPSPRADEWASFVNQAHLRIRARDANVTLREPRVYVDVYYTDTDGPHEHAVRAPFQLGPDEFFAMGDNSVNSNDSRSWRQVPRSYLVGEAFLVLWPLGRMKFVR